MPFDLIYPTMTLKRGFLHASVSFWGINMQDVIKRQNPFFLSFVVSLSLSRTHLHPAAKNFKQIFTCSNLSFKQFKTRAVHILYSQQGNIPLLFTKWLGTQGSKHLELGANLVLPVFWKFVVLCLLYLIKLANLSWKYMMYICMDVWVKGPQLFMV